MMQKIRDLNLEIEKVIEHMMQISAGIRIIRGDGNDVYEQSDEKLNRISSLKNTNSDQEEKNNLDRTVNSTFFGSISPVNSRGVAQNPVDSHCRDEAGDVFSSSSREDLCLEISRLNSDLNRMRIRCKSLEDDLAKERMDRIIGISLLTKSAEKLTEGAHAARLKIELWNSEAAQVHPSVGGRGVSAPRPIAEKEFSDAKAVTGKRIIVSQQRRRGIFGRFLEDHAIERWVVRSITSDEKKLIKYNKNRSAYFRDSRNVVAKIYYNFIK